MQNIFNQLDANAPSHMNAYDLSQRHIFSTKVGLVTPVACFDTMPKDYFEIDTLSLVRSLPLNTAAFARMKVKFDAIFVPYQQLWHGWNQFYLQQEENMSVGTSFNHSALPRLELTSLIGNMLAGITCYYIYVADSSTDSDRRELWSHCGLNYGYDYQNDDLGYNSIFSILRALDMFGYGAYYHLYFIYRSYFLSEKEAGSGPADAMSHFFRDWDNGTLRSRFNTCALCLYQGETPLNGQHSVHRYVNLFRPLAYQKAWQDYVMNKRLQSYDPTYFNLDNVDVLHAGMQDFETLMFKIFTLHYGAWPYDMYTGLYSSPQAGDVSLVDGSANIFLVRDNGNAFGSLDAQARFTAPAGSTRVPLVASGIANTHTTISGPSVYDIKRAEFLQRWKENHLRAGNKLQNQALGQWNTRFKYLSDEYSDFIHSWEMPLNIDEVINTADNQGDISGKGIGTSDGHFKFTASDAGVLLILLTVEPRPEYDAFMIDRQVTTIEPFDFPNPFFDNLGFEAVPRYLLNGSSMAVPSGEQVGQTDVSWNHVLGYAPRYLSWKTAIDKVHGEFMSSGAPSTDRAGQFNIWVAPRREIESRVYQDTSKLCYINPNVVDGLFAAAATAHQESDHFIFNANVLCKVVRNLSVSGQLGWNV